MTLLCTLSISLAGAGPQSERPAVSADIGVRARVVASGANAILRESDNPKSLKELRELGKRASREGALATELSEGGAVIRVEAQPRGDEPLQLLVEYVGN